MLLSLFMYNTLLSTGPNACTTRLISCKMSDYICHVLTYNIHTCPYVYLPAWQGSFFQNVGFLMLCSYVRYTRLCTDPHACAWEQERGSVLPRRSFREGRGHWVRVLCSHAVIKTQTIHTCVCTYICTCVSRIYVRVYVDTTHLCVITVKESQ